MKHLIIVVLLILIPVVYFQHDRIERLIGPTETIQFKVLVKIDGLYHKKFTDVPFTGTVTGRRQGYIKKGQWDGPWVQYCTNGNLESKKTYKDGKKDGPWVNYYKDGQLSFKETYKNGKEDGLWVNYYDNGQSRGKGTYKDGKGVGPWVTYHKNGQLFKKGSAKDGKGHGPWVQYHQNGTVSDEFTGTFKNGVKVK